MGAAIKVRNYCSVSRGSFLITGHQKYSLILAVVELSGGCIEAKYKRFMN
jgi:hypothetical protein